MRVRKVAILIDGGFFLKRIKKLVPENRRDSAKSVAGTANYLCKRHVQKLIRENPDIRNNDSRWLDHVYRLFYYDAEPYDGIAHHPIENREMKYALTPEATFRKELFSEIRAKRKFALRLGKVTKEHDWQLSDSKLTKKLLQTRFFADSLEAVATGQPLPPLNDNQKASLQNLATRWQELQASDIRLGLKQKGVDMRIGVDIATLTLKKHVDTIILVTGDSDFVPAAKVARREGVEFLLDPLWQQVNDDLLEHIDGLVSAFQSPDQPRADNGQSESDSNT